MWVLGAAIVAAKHRGVTTMATKFEFAGVETSLTSTGSIRKPALLKILKSGWVMVSQLGIEWTSQDAAISEATREVQNFYEGSSVFRGGTEIHADTGRFWIIRELPPTAHELMARARRAAHISA
jgi:hypothetical protein